MCVKHFRPLQAQLIEIISFSQEADKCYEASNALLSSNSEFPSTSIWISFGYAI